MKAKSADKTGILVLVGWLGTLHVYVHAKGDVCAQAGVHCSVAQGFGEHGFSRQAKTCAVASHPF
jgi:hypothetical protein